MMDFSSIIGSIKNDLKGFDLTGETSLIISKDDEEKEYTVTLTTLSAEEHILIPELVSAMGEDVTSYTQMDRFRRLTVLFAIRSVGPLDLTNEKYVHADNDEEGEPILIERYMVFRELLSEVPDFVWLDLWNFYTKLVEKQKSKCKLVVKEEKQKSPTLKNKKLDSALKVEGEKSSEKAEITPISSIVGRDLSPEEAEDIKAQLDSKKIVNTHTDEISEEIRDKQVALESVQKS